MTGVRSIVKKSVEAGQRYGRWIVLGETLKTSRGEVKWCCRCDCGTERFVLARSLLYGGSKSCGCLKNERALEVNAKDLTGRTFGELTVLRKAEHQRKNGGVWWLCKCACGEDYEVPGTLLITGRRTHCGGKSHKRNYASADIAGRRFSRLLALHPTEKRCAKGSVIWHCLCDCGNEVDVPYNWLVHSNMRSCGCQKKENDGKLQKHLTRIDGTSMDMLRSEKLFKNNTTGYKGVYFVRGKYMAKIVFKKKAYHLGFYNTIGEAVDARKKAEELLFDSTKEYYARWKVQAEEDPAWGEENPVRIFVSKDDIHGLSISFLPKLDPGD